MIIENFAPAFLLPPSCPSDLPHLMAKRWIAVSRLWVSGALGVSGLLGSQQASASMTSLSLYFLGTVFFFNFSPFQMWNLSAKWSHLKYQLKLEFPFNLCWLYPLLLLPGQVSLCLSQTYQHLEVFILCFYCMGLYGAKFRCPSYCQPWQWSEMLRRGRVFGVSETLSAATVELETSKNASGTQACCSQVMLCRPAGVSSCICCYQAVNQHPFCSPNMEQNLLSTA